MLAAGRSRRFGDEDKRTVHLSNGRPVLESTLESVRGTVDSTLLVLRPDDLDLIDLLDAHEAVTVVICQDADLGMGHSLAAGARQAISQHFRGVFVMLADMPFVAAETLAALIRTFDATVASEGAAIVQPAHDGKPGHPVLFDRAFFEELTELTGDEGARSIVSRHRAQLRRLPGDDAGVLADIDQRSDLR